MVWAVIIFYFAMILIAYYMAFICAICRLVEFFFGKNMKFGEMIKYCYSNMLLLALQLFGFKIYIKGEFCGRRSLWISNHLSVMDGPIIHALLCAKGYNIISVGKKSIQYMPFFGFIGSYTGNVFIFRKKEYATEILSIAAKDTISNNSSILIFPEGATMAPHTKIISDIYAEKNNKPILNNVLCPRETGFDIIKSNGMFDTIGNMTIRYSDPIIPLHTDHNFLTLTKIFPTKMHIDLEYGDIKANELYDIFAKKDIQLNTKIDHNDHNDHNNYRYDAGHNLPHAILSSILMIIFYFLIYYFKYFRNTSFIVSIIAYFLSILN